MKILKNPDYFQIFSKFFTRHNFINFKKLQTIFKPLFSIILKKYKFNDIDFLATLKETDLIINSSINEG